MDYSGQLELAKRAAAGDEAAFAEIYETERLRIFRFLMRLSNGQRERSKDLTQDVFLKAFQKFHTFLGNSSLYTWLCRIAYRTYLMDTRKLRGAKYQRDTISLDALRADDGKQIEIPAPRQFFSVGDGERILGMLPQSQKVYRGVIRLCILEEYGPKETALIMGIPLGTVKSNKSRALAAMRKAAGVAR